MGKQSKPTQDMMQEAKDVIGLLLHENFELRQQVPAEDQREAKERVALKRRAIALRNEL